MINELQEIAMSASDSGTGLFTNNIVTQLLNFVKSLLESILHYVKCKEFFLKKINYKQIFVRYKKQNMENPIKQSN